MSSIAIAQVWHFASNPIVIMLFIWSTFQMFYTLIHSWFLKRREQLHERLQVQLPKKLKTGFAEESKKHRRQFSNSPLGKSLHERDLRVAINKRP